ncbi:prolipoprotein diacylglyceryl transferase family protein [Arthrobacter sp. B10-11]|uniref:prolipoprotein diacylglyceryl transferase family protein n=1 Tax=Arthrobacter sp. B10-11 TaxID=3081160 RepID=UPI002954452F|nr:prolipoprotein diacylglyceryl transferase family protein [Arthrobacter sp. B10-11]MDV8148002.1 prolipoprotein diacylglyceryl transferase [Arthrobacter sp. B10-11]
MIWLPFAGDVSVHAGAFGLGILAALLFYAHEKRRHGLSDPGLWPVAGFTVACGALGSRVLTWDFSRQVSLADWWGNGDRSILAGLVGAWLGVHLGKRILFHVAAFALRWRYRDRLPGPGDLFICYVAFYALLRFGVEFVRGNEMLWLGMSRPQWFFLNTLPLLLWRMLRDSGNHSAQSWKEEWHERRQPRRSLEPTATAPRRGAAL